MIEKDTLLILGAGASAAYGFPTGPSLKSQIIGRIRNEPQFRTLLNDCGFSDEQIERFQLGFAHSAVNSIDAFLQYQPQFLALGKAVTAAALIPCEKTEVLFSAERNWYEYLYGLMGAPFDEFHHNKLRILTFNYDRSLKQFLFVALSNRYHSKSLAECASMLRKITLIHLHGTLGNHAYTNLPEARDFQDDPVTPSLIQLCMKEMRIIYEEPRLLLTFKHAEEMITAAKNVYFIGFSFHELNVQRLGLDKPLRPQFSPCMATGFGLTLHERKRIQKRCKIEIGFVDYDAYDFMRNVFSP